MTEPNTGLSIQDLILIGSVAGGLLVIVQLGDRLWGKREPAKAAAVESPPAQSLLCGVQHTQALQELQEIRRSLGVSAEAMQRMSVVMQSHQESLVRIEGKLDR